MKRREFLSVFSGLVGLASQPAFANALGRSTERESSPRDAILGMYVHQHWPYNHPYAARTWTVEDYRAYADGLNKLGYNLLVIWPLLETVPSPPTPSDRASLDKVSKVIDLLHNEFGMRVMIPLCPNVSVRSEEAAKYTFEKRHFFYCDTRVDPSDSVAIRRMLGHREELLRSLAKVDGVLVIDSDPGGYAGSTNEQFVNLLVEHRKMLDRLRPGIELLYWMHAGWEAYCRFYATGKFAFGTPEEQEDVLKRLKEANLEPWGITVYGLGNNLAIAQKLGLGPKAVAFNYGAIEGEPTFPMTNFGGDSAYKGAQTPAPRGVIGNAQTHCVQLPNTFAFARAAQGHRVTDSDYVEFANQLIAGQGELIVRGWQALPGKDTEAMRTTADKIARLAEAKLTPGPLKGLLFGNPQRFVTDLVMQLRVRAAFGEFVAAAESNADLKKPLPAFAQAVDIWQTQHGYENAWHWTKLAESLRKVNSATINRVLDELGEGPTSFDRVADQYRKTETYTSRLIAAIKEAVSSMS